VIQLFKPDIGAEEVAAITEVLQSGWIGLGPKTAEFEREFASFVGAPYAVGLNSGTAALHLSLILADVGPGDEVIVPSLTFVSSVAAVRYVGATPVFADVDPDTLCVSPEDVASKLSHKTKAIIPVHYGGHPCDMDELSALARGKGITVVEDAAHACGAQYKGRRVGTLTDLTCFSFHAVKNLTTGEGGAITLSDARWDRRLRSLRWMGINRDTWDRSNHNGTYAWQYSIDELGYKCHMSDLAAALGLVQLRRLNALNQRRLEIVRLYNNGLADLPWVQLPVERDTVRSAWHLYAIRLSRRDELIAHLKANGVAPGVHYYPIHMYKFCQPWHTALPVTEREWPRLLSLPLHPRLTDDDVLRIIELLRRFDGGVRCF
jgi:perosamine synthetase